jgi:hypothetical protein
MILLYSIAFYASAEGFNLKIFVLFFKNFKKYRIRRVFAWYLSLTSLGMLQDFSHQNLFP